MMWTIEYGRGHRWNRAFATRHEAIVAWIRATEPSLEHAEDRYVRPHWTSIRRMTGCKTVRVDLQGIEP